MCIIQHNMCIIQCDSPYPQHPLRNATGPNVLGYTNTQDTHTHILCMELIIQLTECYIVILYKWVYRLAGYTPLTANHISLCLVVRVFENGVILLTSKIIVFSKTLAIFLFYWKPLHL